MLSMHLEADKHHAQPGEAAHSSHEVESFTVHFVVSIKERNLRRPFCLGAVLET
tara:strand:+ start:512 stop:673 length:162 start_codon:yes stop_codon:yes gene_type:complete